jgi:hypothetical protein
VDFQSWRIYVTDLTLKNGGYTMEIIQPAVGIVRTEKIRVNNGSLTISLPDFTDDIAVHIYSKLTD